MYTPFKASILLSRALNETLPTNEMLIKFSLELSKFFCRNKAGLDTINHILNNGELSTNFWRLFENGAGVEINHNSLRKLVTQL